MHLRYCRFCRKPVSLDAKTCPHCKGKLMNPRTFKIVLVCMLATIVLVYGALIGSALVIYSAAEHLQCSKPFYVRETGTEPISCESVCTNSCAQSDRSVYSTLLLSSGTVTDSDAITLSCECTCACG